jgi:peptidoglycan hydrolase-like protein with peptidoglycan-binding domain
MAFMSDIEVGRGFSINLYRGNKNQNPSDVEKLQTMLNAIGFNCGPSDGRFGSRTEASVNGFQASQGLPITGRVNASLWYKIKDIYDNGPKTSSSKSKSKASTKSSSYASAGKNNYSTFTFSNDPGTKIKTGATLTFPNEYTLKEIQSSLDNAYKNAPDLIKKRAEGIREIVDRSIEEMKKMYITEQLLVSSSSSKNSKTKVTKPAKKTADNKGKIKKPNMDRWPRNIRYGDRGGFVAELQRLLMDLGYNLGKWGADGHFGPVTRLAVISFQKDQKIKQDGIVGPETRSKLEKV